jgi:hypothetical protein
VPRVCKNVASKSKDQPLRTETKYDERLFGGACGDVLEADLGINIPRAKERNKSLFQTHDS